MFLTAYDEYLTGSATLGQPDSMLKEYFRLRTPCGLQNTPLVNHAEN